jgi:hypothetical protein
MRLHQSSTARLALFASLVAWASLSPRVARAGSPSAVTEAPASSDTSAAGSSAPSAPFGAKGSRALGGSFGFEYADVDGSFYNVGGGPRLGYALRLGDKLALWPMVVLTYDAGTVPVPPATGVSSLQDVRVGAQLPLIMTLGGQVAFELGPVASTDLWRSVGGQDAAHVGLIGLRTGIVGWF